MNPKELAEQARAEMAQWEKDNPDAVRRFKEAEKAKLASVDERRELPLLTDRVFPGADPVSVKVRGIKRQRYVRDLPPETPTRPIPEKEFAATTQAHVWFLRKEKGQSYATIAAALRMTVNAAYQNFNKAKAAIAGMRAVDGFSESAMVDELYDLWDPGWDGTEAGPDDSHLPEAEDLYDPQPAGLDDED